MRIAIVGSGIAGLYAAHRLHREHDVSVFERSDRVGGNVRTLPLDLGGHPYELDVGTSLFNVKTYPRFFELLKELGVATHPADLSYALADGEVTLQGEYQQFTLHRPLSLLAPSLRWLARDAWRFRQEGRRLLRDPRGHDVTLEEFFARGYSREFISRVVFPIAMVAWGVDPQRVGQLSARCVAEYFLRLRPGWRNITGGTQHYLCALVEPFRERIRLRTPVRAIRRGRDHVEVCTAAGAERFDLAVIATHADQALQILADPTDAEREVLGAFKYQKVEGVLHRDSRVMAGAARGEFPSIYVRIVDGQQAGGWTPPARIEMTFYMNRMLGFECPEALFISTTAVEGVAEDKILGHLECRQPVFTRQAIQARTQWPRINGQRRTFYCGAYWGFDEHEDAVNSAWTVSRTIQALSEPRLDTRLRA
jgi:predicted NAD/FAD-binding protein